MSRIAHLGPRGTYTEAAALGWDPDAELLPLPSVAAAAAAVERGEADVAVCALENSIEGSVRETVDLLLQEDTTLLMRGEIVIGIRHALVAAAGVDPAEASIVYSHPQALAQCRARLAELAPKAQPVAALSTAGAIESAVAEPGTLAVGNALAAALYGATIYAEDIADAPGNETRFAVLAHEDHPPSGDDKTSIAFTTYHDRPGTLVGVMQEFGARGLNLTHIESRPTRLALGTYVFLLDLQGHRQDDLVQDALASVEEQTMWLRVLGSYPRWTADDA
ncbi:MAG: prephenate dehydratase [Chloroflexi bacterium]|nr:prephenate dehydratase [Chloroflexota bacterium]MYE45152.1 prephenate dehydratase [Chloroflexota bacterium]